MTDTSIRISTENRQQLKRLMPDKGESYDDVINTLLEETDSRTTLSGEKNV